MYRAQSGSMGVACPGRGGLVGVCGVPGSLLSGGRDKRLRDGGCWIVCRIVRRTERGGRRAAVCPSWPGDGPVEVWVWVCARRCAQW